MAQLTFHGAAETVTGSKYLLEADGARVLVDCGLFQGLKELRLRNWQPLPFAAADVDAVLVTHAHIDHLGFFPRFCRDGFRGPAYCTPATEDLAEILLFDAAHNQETDAEYANRKRISKHHPALPLFDGRDVARALRLLKAVPRQQWTQAAGPIWFRFHDAGHLLGSAMIEVEIRDAARPTRLLFSGDVGRYDAPLYHDPAPPPACDYLVCESTYGNRDHPPEPVLDALADVVTEAIRRGGVLVMASFAVGRAQQLVYLLQVLAQRERIPKLPIYLDSPMAVSATSVFCDHAAEHDLSETQRETARCVLEGHNIHLARSVAESRRINEVSGPAVIISSSGMMTGGRILHHLRQRLPDPRNTIMLGGFMAEGTRGRTLQDGGKYLRIHGGDVPVRARVVGLSALSGHAGRTELLRWLAPLPAPRETFLTHGEKASAEALAETLRRDRGWQVRVPRMGETVTLEPPA